MNWKSHLLLGLAAGSAVCYLLFSKDAFQAGLFAAVSGAAALLPDIDLRKSKISQITYLLGGAAVLAAAIWLSGGQFSNFVIYLGVLLVCALAVDFLLRPRHRRITHSLLFLALAAAAIFFASGAFFAAAFATGYFSHLLSDNSLKVV